MNKNYLRLVGMIVLGATLLGMPVSADKEEEKDQTDPTAKEAILQAFKKMDQTKGFHFEGEEVTDEEDTGSGNTSLEKSTFNGICQTAGVTYLEISKEGRILEIYQKGDQTISKHPDKDEWLSISPQSSPLLRLKGYIAGLKDIKFSTPEKLGRKECKIVTASLDPQGGQMGLGGLANDYFTHFKIIEFTDLLYQVWIGKEDLLPYKISLSFSMKLDPGWIIERRGNVVIEESGGIALSPIVQKITLEIDLDYDKTLEIEIPEEVKELFGLNADPVALNLLVQGFKNLDQTKGFHFKVENTQETQTIQGGSEKESIIEGVWQNPEMIHYKERTDEKEIEVYQKGTETAVKDAEEEKWQLVSQRSPLEVIKTYKDYLANVKFSSGEKIKGKDCKVIEATINFKGCQKLLGYGEEDVPFIQFGEGGEDEITNSLYKVWVGEKDSLLYKVIFSFTKRRVEEEVEQMIHIIGDTQTPIEEKNTLEIEFDYNKVVKIEIPEDLKGPLGLLSDPLAQEAMIQTFKKMEQTKGFHFAGKETEESIDPENGEHSKSGERTIEGIRQNPDITYVKTTTKIISGKTVGIDEMNLLGGPEREVYRKGDRIATQIIEAASGNKRWMVDQLSYYHRLPPEDIISYSHCLKNTKFSGEEKIDGKKCKIVQALLDSKGRGRIGEQRYSNGVPEVYYKVWIGESDALPYRAILDFTTQNQKTTLEINFDYDEEIEIKIPPEVKELFEKGGE